MLDAGNAQALEQSFREFAARPENKGLLEQHQQEEVQAALLLQEQLQELDLQQQVQALDPADQQLLAPVLRSTALRRLLMSMSGSSNSGSSSGGGTPASAQAAAQGKLDPAGGLAAWLANPRVLQLLREAACALRKGRITEAQLLQLLQQQLKQGQLPEASSAQPAAAPHQAQLPSHLLVEALNEHLEERQAGNAAYQRRRFSEALRRYGRALAVVDFVVGSSAHDQGEVRRNRAAVLLNMAAAHMAEQDYGAAVGRCDEALAALAGAGGGGGDGDTAAAAKAWLRRAKANLGRHEYEAALADARAAAELDPWNEDIVRTRAKVLAAQRTAAATVDRQLAARMLGQ